MKAQRMFKPVWIAITAAIALAIASPIYAAPDYPNTDAPNPAFQKLDANHDGYISVDEVAKLRGFENAFYEADDNHDGKLDADEFVKAQAIYDRMRVSAFVTDSIITAKVKAALVIARDLPGFKVNVKTNHGVVLLSGFVENEQQAQLADKIASGVKGVTRVKSNLVVKS